MAQGVTHIRIWHVVNLRMDEPTTFADGYQLVAGINTGNPGEAFGRSQHLDGPWFNAPGILLHSDPKKTRSTSVGDVLEFVGGPLSGALLLVNGIGFTRIDPLTEIDWKTAHGVGDWKAPEGL